MKTLTRIAILAILFMPGFSYAQMVCQPREEVLGHLKAKYKEVPVAIGLTSAGGVLEVVSSGKTWTIIITRPDGLSCFIAAGEGWQAVEPSETDPAT